MILADGRKEFYAIMGNWTNDPKGDPTCDQSYLPTVVHEFNHSFINPLVDKNARLFSSLDQIYRPVAKQMQAQAYGTPQVKLYELLVRACVMLYLEAKGQAQPQIEKGIQAEEKNGFVWMSQLSALLNQYEAQRNRYPALNDFMSRIADFFNQLPPRVPTLIAESDRKLAHVISVQSMANHAADVDPAVQQLVIDFDKPLDSEWGYSINYGEGGKEHYPLIGEPEFLPGNLALRLHVALKPDWSYGFTLTSLAFVTPDGYPLETYTVEFQTK